MLTLPCIYKIRSITTGSFYIGSAKVFHLRKAGHLYDLRNGRHHSIYLQRHYNKYSEADLVFEVIECIENPKDLIQREQYYLDVLKPTFNINPTAGNSLGRKASEHTKQILRELNTGERNRFYGKQHSEETKQKVSQSKKGQSSGEKNYFYGKQFKGELNHMYGKRHSEEAKAKIKEARSRQIITENTKIKMKASAKKGSGNPSARKVICIDNNTIYDTLTEAAKILGANRQDISKVCRGKIKTTAGYRFCYA